MTQPFAVLESTSQLKYYIIRDFHIEFNQLMKQLVNFTLCNEVTLTSEPKAHV